MQVLILTGQNVHDWRGTTPRLKQTLEATGRFEVRVIEEVRGIGPDTLAPYNVRFPVRGSISRSYGRLSTARDACS